MAKSIETIKQDLATLEEATFNMAMELRHLYRKYLDLLKDSVQKQLILASYQICTQTYPQTFLSLSVNQRQSLQKRLREMGKKVTSELVLLLNPVTEVAPNQTIQQPLTQPQSLSFKRDMTTNINESSTSPNVIDDSLLASHNSNSLSDVIPRNPENLVQWYQRLEKSIYGILENISKKANNILHEGDIFPHKIPTQLLNMAIQSNESQESVSGPPNILNLLVEMPNNENSEDSGLTKITAISLKLSEIEFADPLLSSQRNQIHNLLPKLNTLRKQYQNKQQECSIVEAELAWRASWYEE